MLATLDYMDVTHVTKESGDKLYINFSYVLTEEGGDLHWPKSRVTRIELQISDEKMAALRVQILTDALAMAQDEIRLIPLSAGWYNQLGWDEKAMWILALEENDDTPESASSSAATGPCGMQTGKKRKIKNKAEYFPVHASARRLRELG